MGTKGNKTYLNFLVCNVYSKKSWLGERLLLGRSIELVPSQQVVLMFQELLQVDHGRVEENPANM